MLFKQVRISIASGSIIKMNWLCKSDERMSNTIALWSHETKLFGNDRRNTFSCALMVSKMHPYKSYYSVILETIHFVSQILSCRINLMQNKKTTFDYSKLLV